MKYLILMILSIIYLILLDIVWIGMIAKNLYVQEIGQIIRRSGDQLTPNLTAAALVYVAIALGIICFVLPKSEGNIFNAMLWGALFGLVTYGIYDFTNMAVLAQWTWKISIIDVIWGTILCSTASGVVTMIYRWLN